MTVTVLKKPEVSSTSQLISKGDGDWLEETAGSIEKLSTVDEALEKMQSLLLDQAMNYFELGGVLSVIQENGWSTDRG